MVAPQYKSLSFSSLFILILIFTEFGCGNASKPPLFSDPVAGDKGDSNGDQAGAPAAGIEVSGAGGSAATGGTTGTGGTANLSGSGAGGNSGATAGTYVTDSGNPAPPCFNAGTDPDRNQVQPGNICDRLSTIQCAAEVCCCDRPNGDFNTCKQGMMEYCREHLKIDVISSDDATGFDPIVAEQVFTKYEEMASRCDINVVSWGTSPNGLRSIVKGTINPGDPCTPTTDMGQTLDETGAAALASCKDPANTACSHPAPLIWTCSQRHGVEGDCITDLNCLEGLYCDNPSLMLLYATCKARKGVGSPCTFPNECQTLICRNGTCLEVNQQNVFCLSE